MISHEENLAWSSEIVHQKRWWGFGIERSFLIDQHGWMTGWIIGVRIRGIDLDPRDKDKVLYKDTTFLELISARSFSSRFPILRDSRISMTSSVLC